MSKSQAERNRLNDELNEARAGYEAQIQQQTDEFSQARSTFEALLTRQANDLTDLHSALSVSQHESRQAADLNESLRAQNESLRAQLVESENVIGARGEAIALLQNGSRKSGEKNRLLSAQLSSTTRELEQITGSLGWQLLSRYGRLKYRYLLPVYRMLRLAPDSGTVTGDNPDNLASPLLQSHQTAPMAQPQIVQGGPSAQESLEQAKATDERRVALESNSYDAVFDSVNEQAEQPPETLEQAAEVSDQQREIQLLLTQQAEELSGLRERLLVLQTQLYQREETLEQARARILAAETELRYRKLLSGRVPTFSTK